MNLRKATRQKAKIRLGLSAVSGGGKTYSALLIAYGLCGDWSKVALIDTENGSGDLYADLGPYNVLPLTPDFTPEKYIQAIKACEAAGMEVIIIDSASHEWSGQGGCLEQNELLAKVKYKGNTWSAWNETTPRHQKYIDAIISSSCHVITTTRSKTETIQTEDKKIKKVGMKEIQREGFEYELTISLDMEKDGHYAVASKDRTGLFIDRHAFVPTVDTGKLIRQWCEQGVDMDTEIMEGIERIKMCQTPTEMKAVKAALPSHVTSSPKWIDAAKSHYEQFNTTANV